MPAVGPNSAPQTSPTSTVLATQAQQVTVGAPDILMSAVFNCGFCRRVVAQAAGTVFVQRKDDAAPISYVLAAGAAVEGYITLIGGTTLHGTASTIVLNLEA